MRPVPPSIQWTRRSSTVTRRAPISELWIGEYLAIDRSAAPPFVPHKQTVRMRALRTIFTIRVHGDALARRGLSNESRLPGPWSLEMHFLSIPAI